MVLGCWHSCSKCCFKALPQTKPTKAASLGSRSSSCCRAAAGTPTRCLCSSTEGAAAWQAQGGQRSCAAAAIRAAVYMGGCCVAGGRAGTTTTTLRGSCNSRQSSRVGGEGPAAVEMPCTYTRRRDETEGETQRHTRWTVAAVDKVLPQYTVLPFNQRCMQQQTITHIHAHLLNAATAPMT